MSNFHLARGAQLLNDTHDQIIIKMCYVATAVTTVSFLI